MNTKAFVFDLDNTLIKTDKANNLAYLDAIHTVLGMDYLIDSTTRFTRKELQRCFPSLSKDQFESIVAYKETAFESYICETILNRNLYEILIKLYDNSSETILLTNCHCKRAIQLCKFYNLSSYFVQQYFYENYKENKYTFLKSQGYDLQSVVLYENDKCSVQEAVQNGINIENIIEIKF